MSEHADWLPDMIDLNDCGGDWRRYLEVIYDSFCDDLVYSRARFNGANVAVRKIPETFGKGYGFWHCISEGKHEESRVPDMERCKRIRWIRAIIEHFQAPEVDYWLNSRGREICHLLWYREEYLVVLAERKNKTDESRYYLLKTAYCTTGQRRKRALRKERDAYKKTDAATGDDV